MWNVRHKEITRSTNLDARSGRPGDVFTAAWQSGGRGRLDHKWHGARGENLMMSAVIDVRGLDAQQIATLPLAVGLALAKAIAQLAPLARVSIKWPNDIFADNRKIAGILCELNGEAAIAGIGVNVLETSFPPDIAERAASLAMLGSQAGIKDTLDTVLATLESVLAIWRKHGFGELLAQIDTLDALKGKYVSVLRNDADHSPASGIAQGIADDGALIISGERIYAGEVHIQSVT